MQYQDVLEVLYVTARDTFKVYSELDMKVYDLTAADLKHELMRGNEVYDPHELVFFN